jgi:hypothetical protein
MGASLYVGLLVDGTEYLTQIQEIWFYTEDQPLFVSVLKRRLDQLIGGH